MIEKAVPLVEQVRQQLLQWIRDSTVVEDDGALPSESEIAGRLSVSRATVRDALARLERDRIVVRRHGSGTYVNRSIQGFTSSIEVLRDPVALIETAGRKSSIGYQDTRPGTVPESAAEALAVSAGHPAIALSVSYLADAQPAIWMEGTIPVEEPKAIKLPPYATLAQFVSQITGQNITHSIATVEAVVADKLLARRLKVQSGQPLIRLFDTYLTGEGAPVFCSQTYFSPGVIQIQILRKTDGVSRRGGVSVW